MLPLEIAFGVATVRCSSVSCQSRRTARPQAALDYDRRSIRGRAKNRFVSYGTQTVMDRRPGKPAIRPVGDRKGRGITGGDTGDGGEAEICPGEQRCQGTDSESPIPSPIERSFTVVIKVSDRLSLVN